MASVTPTKWTVNAKGNRVAARDARWVAKWRTPDGRSRERWFGSKAEADSFATHIEGTKLSGSYVDPNLGKITFRTYAEAWRKSQVHRPKTAATVERNLRLHVYPRLGGRPVAAIRTSEIQTLVQAMHQGDGEREPLAARSVTLVYGFVVSVFKAAVADRIIGRSPCQDNIRLPRVEHVEVHPMAVETVRALANRIASRYRALVVLGAGTGVRVGEALGVTSDRVDWPRRTLTVNRQLVSVTKDGHPVFGPVKDRYNRPRTIPLPQVVIDALAAHVAAYGLGPEGLLFTGPRGGAARAGTFAKAWRKAADPLGVPVGDGYHQLRHFYASLLIARGASVKVVQARLGHRSATMTLDVYGHLWPDEEDTTRAAVDDVLGAACGVLVGSAATG